MPSGEEYTYCTKTAGNLNKAAIEGFLDAFQANDITTTDFGEHQEALVVAPAAELGWLSRTASTYEIDIDRIARRNPNVLEQEVVVVCNLCVSPSLLL